MIIFTSETVGQTAVISSADYSPYGTLLDGRHGNDDTYRYGFQGRERDDEVSGSGNSYSAEFWQYSPRIGKRWNIDPVVKAHESPYAAFANNPIWFVDPNGADSSVVNEDGVLIWHKESEGPNSLQMRITLEDCSTVDIKLWVNDYDAYTKDNGEWHDDLSRLKTAKVGDRVLFFVSANAINHIMYGSEIGVKDNPFMNAYNNSGGLMDFSAVMLKNYADYKSMTTYTDEELDAQPAFIFFGSQAEFLSNNIGENQSSDPDNVTIYNLMDAGNFLWGQAVYRTGLSYTLARFGSNMNELFGGGDSFADQRAIRNGYNYRVNSANYVIHNVFRGLQLHMFMDYDTGKEYITFPEILWPGEKGYGGGTELYKDHNYE